MFVETINHLNNSINPLTDQPFEIQSSIIDLVKHFDLGIRKRLGKAFYLSSVGCGLGKTTGLSCFLYHYKRSGFQPDNGVLIIVPFLEDVERIKREAGLDGADYAVFTPDEKHCGKGLGSHRANEARILFIAHSMLKKRLWKKLMQSASEFHYRGRTRALRACDEGILPSEPINISIDKLEGLTAPLRPFDEAYVERLIVLVRTMRAGAADTVVRIPSIFRRLPRGYKKMVDVACASLTPDQRNLVQTLSLAGGRELRLMNAKKFGRALVGYGPSLPDDLAPMIIMDGSGDILRGLYDEWAKERKNLVWLAGAQPRYDNLTINVWKTPAGKEKLSIDSYRAVILQQVISLIKSKGEKTLIVCPKDNEFSGLRIEAELRVLAEVNAIPAKDIGFVTYGKHMGVNEFREFRNVVVIGLFRQPELTYQARYMAAGGRPITSYRGDEWADVWKACIQHDLLQAISRANVRNTRKGICGHCNVYVIANNNPDPMALLAGTFPGATVKEWYPVLPELRGNKLRLVEAVTQLKGEGYLSIGKDRLREKVGVESSSLFSQLLGHPHVRQHFDALGIVTEQKFVHMDRKMAA